MCPCGCLWKERLSKWARLFSHDDPRKSRMCTNRVPWEKPILLLDPSSQPNIPAPQEHTYVFHPHKKVLHLMDEKDKAIPAIPPLRSSAMALISCSPGACLPWGHTTQNARNLEVCSLSRVPLALLNHSASSAASAPQTLHSTSV